MLKKQGVVALSQNERDKERRLKVQKARLGVELLLHKIYKTELNLELRCWQRIIREITLML